MEDFTKGFKTLVSTIYLMYVYTVYIYIKTKIQMFKVIADNNINK